VEYVVLKTENSIPFAILKEINPEELNYIFKQEENPDEEIDEDASDQNEDEEIIN